MNPLEPASSSTGIPAADPAADRAALLVRLRDAIDQHVRPALLDMGGDLELVDLDADHILQVRLLGACQGCASDVYNWTVQVESLIRPLVPEVRFVEAVL